MPLYKHFIFLIFALSLVSCGTMVAPKTQSDHLAYAIAAHESLVRSANNLLITDQITIKKAEKMHADLTDVKGYLDSAALFKETGDLLSMENRIQLANTILLKLQANLKEKEP